MPQLLTRQFVASMEVCTPVIPAFIYIIDHAFPQGKFGVCISGWLFCNKSLVGIFNNGILQVVIFTGSTEINSGPACRKIAVILVQPVSGENNTVGFWYL